MWPLVFLTEEEFTKHVCDTIKRYGEKLGSFDLRRFNKNLVDPIKLVFDKTVYRSTWDEIVSSEIFRQRDKSNNNDIGYFHQRIFQYCACFFVEAIAKRSQNVKWETTVDKVKVGHKLIRRVSLDRFYALVTGQDDAFYQMCMILPETIQKAVDKLGDTIIPNDTVLEELKAIAGEQNIESEDLAVAMAVYVLGFGSYKGF